MKHARLKATLRQSVQSMRVIGVRRGFSALSSGKTAPISGCLAFPTRRLVSSVHRRSRLELHLRHGTRAKRFGRCFSTMDNRGSTMSSAAPASTTSSAVLKCPSCGSPLELLSNPELSFKTSDSLNSHQATAGLETETSSADKVTVTGMSDMLHCHCSPNVLYNVHEKAAEIGDLEVGVGMVNESQVQDERAEKTQGKRPTKIEIPTMVSEEVLQQFNSSKFITEEELLSNRASKPTGTATSRRNRQPPSTSVSASGTSIDLAKLSLDMDESKTSSRTGGNDSSSSSTGKKKSNYSLTPRDIFASLNEYVIGQERVKKILSVSVHNHFKVVAYNETQEHMKKLAKTQATGTQTNKPAQSSKHFDSNYFGNLQPGSSGPPEEPYKDGTRLHSPELSTERFDNKDWYHTQLSGKEQPSLSSSWAVDRSNRRAFSIDPEEFEDLDAERNNMKRKLNRRRTMNTFGPLTNLGGPRLPEFNGEAISSSSFEEKQREEMRSAEVSQPPREEKGVEEEDSDVDHELLRRIMEARKSTGSDVSELDKSNILILGPTGSGKTLLAKTLSKMTNVPLVICDATSLTQAGYVGDDVESILSKLYQAAEYDLELAQKGIVYIDEIDKVSRASLGSAGAMRDVSGEGVQQALLKILEGSVCNVQKKTGQKGSSARAGNESVQFNTKNVLFICGGAFAGMENLVKSRTEKLSIGFGAKIGKKSFDLDTEEGASSEANLKSMKVLDDLYLKTEPSDLVSYGLIPEFVGRFSHIVSTSQLTIDELVNILTIPKNALVKQFKTLFALQGVELVFTPEAIRKVANLAMERRTGARGLRSILDKALMETMFELPEKDGVRTVVVTEDVIKGEAKPYYVTDIDVAVDSQCKDEESCATQATG